MSTHQPISSPLSWRSALRGLGLAGLVLGLSTGCNLGQGSGGVQAGTIGARVSRPDGSTFFVDPNGSGDVSRLVIEEMFWGRLVDVHDVDLNGDVNAEPLFTDFAINEKVNTDLSDYILETNAITQRQRLIIRRTDGEPDAGNGTFEDLLLRAASDFSRIAPKNDNGTSAPPFSFVARNSVLVVRFNDALRDDPLSEVNLTNNIKVLTGYPPSQFFPARMVFDRNYGANIDDGFHATRVLIDMTVSETEETPTPLQTNLLGLPASLTTTEQPNLSIRIPSSTSVGEGQFSILRSLGGKGVATSGNGPVDFTTETIEVVRALRTGNAQDAANGFLTDDVAPEILGDWPVTIDAVVDDPAGTPGFDFIADLSFSSICQGRPEVGDVISTPEGFLEVTRLGSVPVNDVVRDLKLRYVSDTGISNPNILLGTSSFQNTYDPSGTAPAACWLSFSPPAAELPATGVDPDARVVLNFTEPMDPSSLGPFSTFSVFRGPQADDPSAVNTVVGNVDRDGDLRVFNFQPLLPFAHEGDTTSAGELYHVAVGSLDQEVTDLAGNPIVNALPEVEFSIDPTAPPEMNASVVLRFSDLDEYQEGNAGEGRVEWRGQVTLDLDAGVIQPRRTSRVGYPIDQSNPVPALMQSLPFNTVPVTSVPLSPLGSKLQTVWRYCDAGWLATDESKFNIDIEGIQWSPVAGQVSAEFYEEFEIKLAHSLRLPDEYTYAGAVIHSNSGLFDMPSRFDSNVLQDPENQPVVVHNRALGYRVDPADLGQTSTGTPIMPYPMNRRGGRRITYTWQNTAILATGGAGGAGVPMDVEFAPNPNGANLSAVYDRDNAGSIYPAGGVRSVALPLLMEFATFPSNSAIGLNRFNAGLGQAPGLVPTPRVPNFRIHSTGGTDSLGNPRSVNPDLELSPGGGFNPISTPPGLATPSADNTFYFGQIDTVIRISRAYSIWFRFQDDLLDGMTPNYLDPILDPAPADQPAGTQVLVDYRGASFVNGANRRAVDAEPGNMDIYGDIISVQDANITFFNDDASWFSSIQDLDGAVGVQIRLTFVNDISSTGLSPTLSTLALAAFGEN